MTTALHTAIRAKKTYQEIDELLAELKGNFSEKDEERRNVFHIAAGRGDTKIFQLLVNKVKRIDLNAQDNRGWTPLHIATSKGHYTLIQYILSCKSIKPMIPNNEKNTPFLFLCQLSLDTSEGSTAVADYYQTISAFIARGIDINEQNKAGDSPLHCAARCGNSEAVDFLCRNNADVNVVNGNNESPLFIAIQGRRSDNVRCLLEFGGDIAVGNQSFEKLLQAAGSPIIASILSNIQEIRVALEEKKQELESLRKRIQRDQTLYEELEKTLKKDKKASHQGKNALAKVKHQKIIAQELQICDRFNSLFYTGRSGVWSCCIKRIQMEENPDSFLASKTAAKLQFLTELSHEGVLSTLFVNSNINFLHIAVSWPSTTLAQIVERNRSTMRDGTFLPFHLIKRYALEIAEPLEYLHEQRIVCRNIKMGHIFSVMKEKSELSKLMLSPYYASSLHTMWPILPLNKDYYEPSFSLSTETRFDSFDLASDIWSFGTVLFELLTLTKPYSTYHGCKIQEFMKIQGPELPPCFSSFPKGKHYEEYKVIVELINSCLEVNAEKRPSIGDIISCLRNNTCLNQSTSKKAKKSLRKKLISSSKITAFKSILPQDQWPKSAQQLLPFHIMPQITSSPLILHCDTYVIEAPLSELSKAENPILVQFQDNGKPHFKDVIAPRAHDNFISIVDDAISIVSIEGEKEGTFIEQEQVYEYKAIVRSIEGEERILVQCAFPKDRVKVLKQHPSVVPFKLQLSKDVKLSQKLIEYEAKHLISKTFKFGVVYRKKNQKTDDEMFSNQIGSPGFDSFVQFLGTKISLKGWSHYRGGLDVATDNTGNQSVYCSVADMEIMFHVSTLLPFDKGNPQQLHRKRHIGSDIVVVIFQDAGADPFDPSEWTSGLNHVFVVIQPKETTSSPFEVIEHSDAINMSLDLEDLEILAVPVIKYEISVMYKNSIKLHPRPFLQEPCSYVADDKFRQFLLTKLINCERTAMRAPSFTVRSQKVRQQLLEDLCKKSSKK